MKGLPGHYAIPLVLGCLLAAAFLPATASAAPAAAPDTGSVLYQSQPPLLLQPPREAPSPIRIEEASPAAPPAAGGPKITVRGFRIDGDCPVPIPSLQALLQKDADNDLTVAELHALASRLTSHLRQQGFLVAVAYLPAQDVTGGIVAFTVVPGRYGAISVKGGAHVNDAFLRSLFRTAQSGGIIRRAPLERALLSAGDFPGLSVKTTLTPGKTQGTADLLIEAADAQRVTGAVYTDNRGSRYTGTNRFGAQVSYNNLSGFGDVLSLVGVTTLSGMNNHDFGYSAPLGGSGLRGSLHQSQVFYTLGDTFTDMNATGQANTTSAALTYPLIRSRSFSLAANFGFDRKRLQDDIESVNNHILRADNLWNLGLSGAFSDSWGGGGNNAFSLTYSRGNLSFENDIAAAVDDATAQTVGAFGKMLFSYQRQQYLRKNLQLNLNFAGQWSDKNLDSSEKFFLGGATGVRAYPQGEASGDQGYRLSAEMRLLIPGLSTPRSSFFATGFFDCGAVQLNKTAWAEGNNFRSLSGAGVGLLWTRGSDYSLRLDYAWKTSAEAATSDTDKSGRLWLQAVKYF